MRDGWISGMNMAAYYPRPPADFPLARFHIPLGHRSVRRGSCEIMLDAYTYSGLSSKVDINSCVSAL
jgi:hypothetical protein